MAPFDGQNVWKKIIAEPFAAGDPATLRLLDGVLRATVMRHSKSQVLFFVLFCDVLLQVLVFVMHPQNGFVLC